MCTGALMTQLTSLIAMKILRTMIGDVSSMEIKSQIQIWSTDRETKKVNRDVS